MVNIRRSHRRARGSIPRIGAAAKQRSAFSFVNFCETVFHRLFMFSSLGLFFSMIFLRCGITTTVIQFPFIFKTGSLKRPKKMQRMMYPMILQMK
jgi:hypothetical protein